MKKILLFSITTIFALSACTTSSDYLISPNMAKISVAGNPFTNGNTLARATLRRCAQVCVKYGYKYFNLVNMGDESTRGYYTTPGYADTTIDLTSTGNGNGFDTTGTANTTYQPPQTVTTVRPGIGVIIYMTNDWLKGPMNAVDYL